MKNYILTFLSIFLLIFSEGAKALSASACDHDASKVVLREDSCNSNCANNYSCAECVDFLEVNKSRITAKRVDFSGKILYRNKNTAKVIPDDNCISICHPPGIDFHGFPGKLIRHNALSSIIILT